MRHGKRTMADRLTVADVLSAAAGDFDKGLPLSLTLLYPRGILLQ